MNATIHFGDCITGMAEQLEPESIDLCVTSIPFGALFTYSGKPDDIGNNRDGIDLKAEQFGLHMRFFIEQLYRGDETRLRGLHPPAAVVDLEGPARLHGPPRPAGRRG